MKFNIFFFKHIHLVLLVLSLNTFSQVPNISKGDVAYFPFNGSIKDESGNSNHFGITTDSTQKEAQVFLVKDRWGDENNALKLSGNNKTNAYVVNSNSFKTIESKGELSFSVWFLNQNNNLEKAGTGSENVFPIITKLSSVDNMGWSLLINKKGQLEFNASSLRKVIFDYDFPAEKWQNIVFTYKSPEGIAQLFIDGQLIKEQKSDNNRAGDNGALMRTDGDLFLGWVRRENKDYSAHGVFDDIRIYNRILMNEEVNLLYTEKPDRKKPYITISNYDFSNANIPKVIDNKIKLSGVAYDDSPMKLYINGVEARVNPKHLFEIVHPLELGVNNFTLQGVDSRNNRTIQNYSVERIEGEAPSITQFFEDDTTTKIAQNEVVKTTETPQIVPKVETKKTGNYYALIIGNSNYQSPEIKQLDNPINDAGKLYDVLTKQYNFDTKYVTFLRDATFRTLITELDRLSDIVTANDNILIFYAGHGYWDEKRKLGYWLPSDAEKSNTANWLANSRLKDYINSLMSKHTLVISDACFSGGIFKTRSAFSDASRAINALYESPSRKAMTSGTLTVVPDDSKFLYYLVKKLQDNTQKYLSADKLFNSFREIVLNNSPTEPQYGVIQDVGDEGGEFIFIKRD